MAKSVLVRVSLVRAALLGATALSLFSAPFTIGEAAAKVGVTSATDGDPLGKPPQEAERVLRIGIDVQANELITTNANDRAHLVFLDGSSLTVGPNAQLTIDKFVFDPSHQDRRARDQRQQGRAAPGRRQDQQEQRRSPSRRRPAPSASAAASPSWTSRPSQTDSTFVFGKDMTVRGAGQTQVATRPGSMIVTNLGSPPGMPTHPGPGRPQCTARRSRRPARTSGQQRRRRQRTQPRSGRAKLRAFGRQLRPVGAHHRARRAGQFRFRPGPAQSQSQRHGCQRGVEHESGDAVRILAHIVDRDYDHAAAASSRRRRPRRRRRCRHRRRRCRPPAPAEARRRRRPAPRHSAGLQLAADRNGDIRWRNDRCRERPYDLYR